MRKRSLAAIAALSLGGSFVIGGFIAAPALAADAGNVDIRVELDYLGDEGSPSDGPAVFEVTNVTIGAGPELTGANLTENPSGWCGSVIVDVDPDAKTITVSPDDDCNFTDVKLVITSPEFGAVTLVSDELLWPDDDYCYDEYCEDEYCEGEECPFVTVTGFSGGGSGGVFSASRILPFAAPGSVAALNVSFSGNTLTATWKVDQSGGFTSEWLGGSTVFSYGAAAPTPPSMVDTSLGGMNNGWAFLFAGALAAIGAVALGGTLMLRRQS